MDEKTAKDEKTGVGEQLLTAVQVAELLRVSARTALALDIPRVKIGTKLIRFRLADVRGFIDRQST